MVAATILQFEGYDWVGVDCGDQSSPRREVDAVPLFHVEEHFDTYSSKSGRALELEAPFEQAG